MCLLSSNIRAAAQWNWEGDTIVHDPIILAWRKVPGTDKRYDIDIREFISSKDNSVIGKVVGEIASGLDEDERSLFRSRGPHSFDLRMRAVTAYIAKNIAYEPERSPAVSGPGTVQCGIPSAKGSRRGPHQEAL